MNGTAQSKEASRERARTGPPVERGLLVNAADWLGGIALISFPLLTDHERI